MARAVVRKIYNRTNRRHTKSPSEQLPQRLWLVDCTKREITDWSADKSYLALSYLWGNSHTALQSMNREAKMRLLVNRELPQTIEDAIQAVLGLKHQFLWVDMICVSPEDKHHQIQQMHLIYENAIASIVTLDSPNADFGIYGISRPRCYKQISKKIKNFSLISVPPSIQAMCQASEWVRRGWTYQDALLSSRCIFFTRFEAYFTCREGTRRESIVASAPLQGAIGPQLLGASVPYIPGERDPSDILLGAFVLSFDLYKQRHLSYEQDTLSAYKGI